MKHHMLTCSQYNQRLDAGDPLPAFNTVDATAARMMLLELDPENTALQLSRSRNDRRALISAVARFSETRMLPFGTRAMQVRRLDFRNQFYRSPAAHDVCGISSIFSWAALRSWDCWL